MKLLAPLLTLAIAANAVTASCNYGMAMRSYQEMMKVTSLASAGGSNCCPLIVPPGPTGSVISGYSGFNGNAAIIVDYGTCSAQPVGGFLWYVSWGDGSYDYQRANTLGPFQVTHQYPMTPNSYEVFAYYCSTPQAPYVPCCDVLYQQVNVSN